MNGLDDAERAEVLYDVYAANVYQNGNGEDEQGRVLHTMFDQVIIENVSFKSTVRRNKRICGLKNLQVLFACKKVSAK